MSENILCVKNIKKSFGGVHALKGVDLTIKRGETHCLAGENGCGKSTIIKVISGFYKPDEGTIEIDGKEYTNMSTADAIAAGIQVIYQDFSIFPNLTVMENLAFNQVLAEKKKIVNKKEFRKIAEEAVKKINFDVDLDARVETLPVADKQLIAISRALLHNAKLIIMDEPTTALTKREVTRLFGIIEELKKEGITILFVSHKLDEVFEISDSITILRSGQNVHHCPASEMTEEKFTYYMTGRNIDTSAVKEVKDFFTDFQLDEQKVTFVCEYLTMEQVDVADYEPGVVPEETEKEKRKPEFSEEELRALKQYLDEFPETEVPGEKETAELYRKAAEGDSLAKSMLVQLWLPRVIETAKELHNRDFHLMDLVQEGNVGLLVALEEIQEAETAEGTIDAAVRETIRDFMEEHRIQKHRDNTVVNKVNRLKDAIEELSDGDDMDFSVAELSAYLDMSVEEIEDILRIAGEEQ